MRYLQRSLKYFLSLCVLYAAIIYCFSFATYAVVTPGDRFHALMSTPRGMFLLGAMFLLSAVYPYFGYMRRYVDGDLVKHREAILRSCTQQKLKLDHESEGRMTFIADSYFKRVTMMFEDHIKVVQDGEGRLVITGNRKVVAFLVYRLEGAISAADNGAQE